MRSFIRAIVIVGAAVGALGCADVDEGEQESVASEAAESEDPASAPEIAEQSQALHIDASRKDFNRDGRTDILWHNPRTGTVNTWWLSGVTVIANPNVNWNVLGSSGWVAKGTGDFNADGRTDILWHHPASGQVNVWLLNGTTVIGNPNINWRVLGSSGWQLKGTGDFNGDGKTDLLWHHPASGQVNVWLLNGTNVIGNPNINWNVLGSSGWQLKGTGDFNRDGKTDLLWHHAGTGTVNTWLLNGTTVIGNPNINWKVLGSSGWQLKGTGDFNRDGKTDLLWHHPGTGVVNTWLLSGTTVIGNPSVNWNVLGTTGWQIVSR